MSAARSSPTLLSPNRFAEHLSREYGVTFRARRLRDYCEQGMAGAKKKPNGWWAIDPERAIPWLRQLPGSRIGRKVRRAQLKQPPKPPEADTAEAGEEEVAGAAPSSRAPSRSEQLTERHLELLEYSVTALAQQIARDQRQGSVDADKIDAHKKASTELRLLREHIRKEREAGGRLISREEHERLIEGLALLDRRESDALARTLPDAVLQWLHDGGIEIARVREARRLLVEVIEREVNECLRRKAQHIRRMGEMRTGEVRRR